MEKVTKKILDLLEVEKPVLIRLLEVDSINKITLHAVFNGAVRVEISANSTKVNREYIMWTEYSEKLLFAPRDQIRIANVILGDLKDAEQNLLQQSTSN